MRRLLRPLIVLLVLVSAFAWWWWQPERVVARRVAGLFDAANVPADSGNITRSTRGTAIEGFLAPRVTFEGPESAAAEEVAGTRKRDDIVAMYGALAKFALQASIRDLSVQSVSVDGDRAEVAATVDALIELRNQERPVDGIQHLELAWRKIEGKWLLERAKWHETGR